MKKIFCVVLYLIIFPLACFGANWELLVHPDNQVMDFVISPFDSNKMAIAWLNGVATSENKGKFWDFQLHKYSPSRIVAYNHNPQILAGLDRDVDTEYFKNFFLYQINGEQYRINPDRSVIHAAINLDKDAVFNSICFSNNSNQVFLSSRDNLYLCTIPLQKDAIWHDTISAVWKKLTFNQGFIQTIIRQDKNNLWIFGNGSKNNKIPFSLGSFNINSGSFEPRKLILENEEVGHQFNAPYLWLKEYYFNPKEGTAFFSEANYFLYSVDYGLTFKFKQYLETNLGYNIYPLYIVGKNEKNIYVLGVVSQINKDKNKELIDELAKDIPSLSQLYELGKSKYPKSWEQYTSYEKNSFYKTYLKQNFPKLNENTILEIMNNPNIAYKDIAIYVCHDFSSKADFVTTLPLDIKEPQISRLYLDNEERTLYLVNKGIWKIVLN